MSDDEELLFGLLGTQFNTDADEQTEFKRSKLKRKAAEEEVVDAKGRATRFHGAFTGGFSAGYFNTVGSKEGFQPSDFVCRGKTTARNYRPSKPEDFMDEEDFDENGIAPKLLRTKSIFDNEDIRKHMKQSLGNHDIVGDSDILRDILVPQSMTIGLKLLLRLGYLASRGVGEKVKIEEDDECGKTKFDYESEETFQLTAKSDKFGLGYSGMRRDLIGAPVAVRESRGVNFGLRGKKGIRGVAFGGVDEEEDDGGDMGDVFVQESMARYNYEIEEDEDKANNFGWTAPKNLRNKAIMPSDSLPGFHLGTKRAKAERTLYPPPELPRFYLPIYPIRRREEQRLAEGGGQRPPNNTRTERPRLMPDDDGTVAKSVFSLLSSEDRERVLGAGGKRRSRWGDQEQRPTEGNQQHREIAVAPPRRSLATVSDFSARFRSAGRSTAVADEQKTSGHRLGDGEGEMTAREAAAEAGSYGFMTRTRLEWHPDQLMCRRFNVPPPFPGCKMVGVRDEFDTSVEAERAALSYSVNNKEEEPVQVPMQVPVQGVNFAAQVVAAANEESETSAGAAVEVVTVCERAGLALFKAVFDDPLAEFSDDDDEEEKEAEAERQRLKTAPQETKPISIVASMEMALSGLFGGPPAPSKAVEAPPVPRDSLPRLFGPTPPPDFVYNPVTPSGNVVAINEIISRQIVPTAVQDTGNDDSDDAYVYVDKPQHSKKSKHQHHKKAKKSKSTKKDKTKKKHKKKKSSKSDTSD